MKFPVGAVALTETVCRTRSFGVRFATVGQSAPTFFLGILFILLFSVTLHWLPAFGRGETVLVGGWSTGLLTPSGRMALILPIARSRCTQCR